MISNSKILITGGTGSLGRELANVLAQNNNEIIVYSRNEERQFDMSQDLKGLPIQYRIGDVRDIQSLKSALYGCDIAIHAAAMKDLIMCEAQAAQCVMNNIIGTMNFLQAVKETPSVTKAVGVSTDKAASPSNVYGCSKYIMEQLVHEAARTSECIFSCARFGNMIDSTGSLISTWKANPTTEVKLTHPDVARFFFTVNDAALTVIEGLENAKSGETRIKKMKAARIYDILRLITKRTEFEIMGLFPGEKVHEELVSDNEVRFCHDDGDFYVIRPDQINDTPPDMFSTENASYFDDQELSELMGL
ncbi:putative UDP-N-acetylglucosamine 4,6-dehydratase (inverting) [Candidatus Terasakiella magnetica]|uniref:Putative UDP-N-acetylglucosamine 4,6-dehydratase (Inverting) n=1 Tax=Candidatus Terasakiella magnetica TaxID=1867952 RepID=A0A1C3RGF4_9PROT|nr:SDR family NAD(P)-dependent oxidoreductase [Candidatus Terasakiella magnetica]SCA56294.1 putative UDP-N-acetylglucosamine 4,6-dehydratase (inverting) [Candidatus Terasakiella magnetica]